MPTTTLTLNWTRGGDSIAKNVSITEDGAIDVDTTLTASQANKEVDIAINVSKLTSLYLSSDKATTILTNSTGSPADTLTLVADKPLVWYSGCGLPNPFASTTNVTKLYLTNGAASGSTVKIRIQQDVTP